MMTREQEQVLTQSERILHAKLEVLDTNLDVIQELTGRLIDGSYTISAKVGARRTCSIKLHLDKDILPSPSSPIWLNKRFRMHIGITSIRTDEVVWFPIGTFAISDPTRDIELKGKDTFSVKGTDFVAFMDGTLGGSLDKNYKINCGDMVYNAIQNTFAEFTNFKTNIIPSDLTIPYEFEKDMGDSQWDIIEELLELYLHYEGFFDVYGTFIYQQSSDLITDSVVWDFSQDKKNLIVDYNITYNWDDVRNRITCIGKEKDGVYPYYTEVAVSTDETWSDCPFTVDRLGEVETYKYKVPQPYLDEAWNNIQSETRTNTDLGKMKTYIEENGLDKDDGVDATVGSLVRQCFLGHFPESELKTRLKALNLEDYFQHLMTSLDTGIYRANPRSLVVKETSYYKKEQCVTRVQYELDKRLACAETVKITCLPIYGLDANQLIYLDIDDGKNQLSGKYCIDNISCKLSYSGTMTITCHKVTRNRYSVNQSLLYEKDDSGSSLVKVIDYDGTIRYIQDNKDSYGDTIVATSSLNSIFNSDMIYAYRLSMRDEWEIEQLLILGKSSGNYRIYKNKNESDCLYIMIGSGSTAYDGKLYRDDSRNWYTDEYAIGQDLAYDAGWIGTTTLPSFWNESTVKDKTAIETIGRITELDGYLPYSVVDKFNLTKTEAKAISWVGIQYGKITGVANDWDRHKSMRYILCYVNSTGGDLLIKEKLNYNASTNRPVTELQSYLYRDDNGNWYSDNYWYGQSLFKDEGWVGDNNTGLPKWDFTMEEQGYLRLKYDDVMSGKINLSE